MYIVRSNFLYLLLHYNKTTVDKLDAQEKVLQLAIIHLL